MVLLLLIHLIRYFYVIIYFNTAKIQYFFCFTNLLLLIFTKNYFITLKMLTNSFTFIV